MNHTRFSLLLKRALCATLAVVFAVMAGVSAAQAGNGSAPVVVRDTEIEAMIKEWTTPVVEAAGLTPDQINIILVQNDAVNAFVAGGPNIFVYTGLLDKTENPGEVVGVVAHELGHIRGGHLIRMHGAFENASYGSLLGTLLGLGAAVLTGDGGLGTAVAAGASSMAQRNLLSFSRVQESSADQAALSYMEGAEINPVGLKSFMEKLKNQELLPTSQQDEYVRTHPLTSNRIEALSAGYKKSAMREKVFPTAWVDQHARMLAKLKGFIHPEQVAWDYNDRDQSLPVRYARAIALYRQDHVNEALAAVDGLLAAEPDNPFFLELKGQMLMEFGRVREALPVYKRSVTLYPQGALIRTAYAHALIETAGHDRAQLEEAVTQLKRVQPDEPRSLLVHHLLATAYGRMGQEPPAKLHLAEEALLKGNKDYAARLAKVALEGLPEGSGSWLRAQDILTYVESGTKKD